MARNPNFKPVKTRQTVQDQVYQQLREALVSGAFEAGESFTIPGLSEKFMTSHMPIREALRRLAAENALRVTSTGTAIVPPLDAEELRKINETRLILEPASAGIAFDKIDEAGVEQLRQTALAHAKTVDTGDVVEMLNLNRAFHFGIYEATGNDVLCSQIENLWLRSGAYVRFLSDRMGDLLRTSYRSGFSSHHDDMLAALGSGDKDAFVQAMHDDIQATSTLLLDFLNEPDS